MSYFKVFKKGWYLRSDNKDVSRSLATFTECTDSLILFTSQNTDLYQLYHANYRPLSNSATCAGDEWGEIS